MPCLRISMEGLLFDTRSALRKGNGFLCHFPLLSWTGFTCLCAPTGPVSVVVVLVPLSMTFNNNLWQQQKKLVTEWAWRAMHAFETLVSDD